MATEFGLDAEVCAIDIKDFLSTERGLRAMEKGDIVMVMTNQEFDDEVDGMSTDWGDIFKKSCSEFKPDLLIWTSLMGGEVSVFKQLCPDVPDMLAAYQPHCVATNHIQSINMQRLELEPGQPLLFTWVLESQSAAAGMFQACQEQLKKGEEPYIMHTPQVVYEGTFNLEEQPTPKLMAYSPSWWPAYDDWPKKNLHITGNWKIPKEVQEEAALKGGTLFDAGGQHQVCTDFINGGEKPVYIGWGSMMVYSKEHMARLAVGALKEAGKRGIIVGGWAELSEESLGGDEHEELKAFSRNNVLFLKSAPHEWLFPQMACCVHHGGIGTTQASLSAGVPTVVTPVFSDQKDIGEKMNRDKTGAGTCHLSQLTAKELGARIKKCCEDPTILSNCTKLAEKMQKEDGVKTTVEFVEGYMKEQVASGEWKKKRDALIDRLQKAHQKFKKLSDPAQIFAKWNMDLAEKYPPMAAYMQDQVERYGKMTDVLSKKKLWYVKSSSGCLARKGEALKSDECGRYKEYAVLEEVGASKNGSRLHVRRLKGIGPEEGWVSPVVSGKDIVVKVASAPEIQKITFDAIQKQFADIVGKPS